MRLQRSSRTATIAVLVMFSAATTTVAHAQSTDELKQRIEELERSTREQVDALKRMLQQQEAERAKRSEEHTSELQSQSNLVCRLLLEKKNRWSSDRHRFPRARPL